MSMEEGLSTRALELRLAPPGDQEDIDSTCITKSNFNQKHYDPSLLSLGNSYSAITNHTTCAGSKRVLEKSWLNESHTHKFASSSSSYQQQEAQIPVMGKESSPRCRGKGVVVELQNTERQQAILPNASAVKKADGVNASQKRVLWTESLLEEKLILKLMIASYNKLSCWVDDLFRDLLAAQRDPSDDKIQNGEREKLITGSKQKHKQLSLLDHFLGNGSTIAYELGTGITSFSLELT